MRQSLYKGGKGRKKEPVNTIVYGLLPSTYGTVSGLPPELRTALRRAAADTRAASLSALYKQCIDAAVDHKERFEIYE